MALISNIIIYPFKSLPGMSVDSATFTSAGGLVGDREFAFFTPDGRYVNGKRFEAIHRIRASFDVKLRVVTLWSLEHPEPQSFHMDQQRLEITAWVSKQLGLQGIELKHDPVSLFPDDRKSPGPTIGSEASLIAAGQYFTPTITLSEMINRMRVNIIIKGVEAYWEDSITPNAETGGILRLGKAELIVTNPCSRCVVPTRNPETGIPSEDFMKTFMQHRKLTLPAHLKHDFRYEKNPYRLTVNVLGPAKGMIRIGDKAVIGSKIPLGDFSGKTSTALIKPIHSQIG